MLESIVNFLSECGLVSAYIKLAVVLYVALYVIEEVLGKYSSRRPSQLIDNEVNGGLAES